MLLEPIDPARKEGDARLPPLALRQARAKEVKALAEEFVEAFVNAAGEDDAATVYCHILQCHIPSYILWYGDLLNYGCHGSEHAHSVTKDAFKRGCSKQPKKRVGEAFKHLTMGVRHSGDYLSPTKKARKD